MQSASLRGGRRALRARLPRPGSANVIAGALVALLTYTVASSAVAAAWVPGSRAVVPVALAAALLMGMLALVRRVPAPVALAVGVLAAPAAAFVACGTGIGDASAALSNPTAFASHLASGAAAGEPVFFLFALCLLFWATGGWLAWCALRWRRTLLGLVPGAAAFTTTLLNYPDNQNGYMLSFLVLTLSLLLWTQFHRAVGDAAGRGVRLSGDSRWDFWETGAVVTAAVVALGIFLPPMSRVDRTIDIQNGAFRGWAELQQRLNHPVAFGAGGADGYSIGFSEDVRLGPTLKRSSGVVFTYTVQGEFGGPRYFAGAVDHLTENGAWTDRGSPERFASLARDVTAPIAEKYAAQGTGTVKVNMLKPPRAALESFFYPGQLASLDRPSVLHEVVGFPIGTPARPADAAPLNSVDRVTTSNRQWATGTYTAKVLFSKATEQQLRDAGTAYPAWLDPYRNFGNAYRLPGGSVPDPMFDAGRYRIPPVERRIHDLALRITQGAGNPYDQAQAIESYLRGNYTYSLAIPDPPAGSDRLAFFLFNSRTGYCEYFATAMGDMLRSLGIPTRLVNGFGPGTYDDKLEKYVVREADAHTWVEAYFPGYGWVPFEPTPDGQYFPVARGFSGTASCVLDNAFCDPAGESGTGAPTKNPSDKGEVDPGTDQGTVGGGGFVLPPAPVTVPVIAAVLLLLAVAGVAVSRYLRPSTASGAWRRTGLLARLGGVARRPGETPLEFGRRLGEEAPEAREPAGRLAAAYAFAAYAHPDAAAASRRDVLDAYRDLLPVLLSRIRERNRFN